MAASAESHRPFVFVNMAMTADGKITSAAREYPEFASRFDRRNMDRLRARADAILVGAGTMRADDPPLHVRDPSMRIYRRELGKPEGLDRVLVSASLDLPPTSRFFATDHGGRCLIATVDEAPEEARRRLPPHAEILRVGRDRVDPERLLVELRRRGVEQLLLEGGGELNWQFVERDLVDELNVTVAPALLGGRAAPTLLEGEGLAMADQRRLQLVDLHREGHEIFLRYRVLR